MAAVKAAAAARLRAELESELTNLETTLHQVVARIDASDDTTTMALALLLMNYYSGAENMFRRISQQFGESPPLGDRWHTQLLDDMTLVIRDLRPSVLTVETGSALNRLLKFRHAVRHLYAWTLRRNELQSLVDELAATHAAVTRDVSVFVEFLDALVAAG